MIESRCNPEKARKNYLNPTIAESLCEIHFDCNSSEKQPAEMFLKALKSELSSDYPSVTEQQIKQFQAAITEMGISVNEDKVTTTRLIFKHKERNHMIQFLPNVLTINEVQKYPGWNLFSQDICRGWKALTSSLPEVCVKRIGLRYINLIPRRNPLEPLSAWLKSNIYYPTAILNSSSGFSARNEFDIGNNIRLIITLSEPAQKEKKGGIVFDIDVIVFVDGREMNWSLIKEQLEILHKEIWQVFSTSLSQKYESLLNGELL